MTDPSRTPEYDALCATIASGVAYGREHGGINTITVALMKIRGKAITSGQRAGERAAHNVYDAHPEVFGNPAAARERLQIAARADEAAKIASARARERYTVKALTA